MTPTIRLTTIIFMILSALAICVSAKAQQPATSAPQRLVAYNLGREVTLLGTVLKYEPASSVAPLGAHVLLQTPSGQVDVHLGNVKLLQARHFELNAGDSVRIIGEDLAYGDGKIFAARIVQKGAQAVAVRNTKGFQLTPASALTPAQLEALRGVR